MALYVNTNVSSLQGRNNLYKVNLKLDTTYQRLSSGLRINSAKDDAAGLQIADRMTADVNGMQQANRNAADGIALIQIIEGASDEIGNMLQRMRTLAVQAANGTNTQEDLNALQKETDALADGIIDICFNTTYGGKKVLLGYRKDAADGIGQADGAPTLVNLTNYKKTSNNPADPKPAQTHVVLQVGAYAGDTIDFNAGLFSLSGLAGRSGFNLLDKNAPNTALGLKTIDSGRGFKIMSIDVSSHEQAGKAIEIVDAAIKGLGEERANAGATMNRLESSIRNQSNAIANESDARSRIRDTDFAEESALLAQQNIIQQSSTSMLMQANARPQLALSLLG